MNMKNSTIDSDDYLIAFSDVPELGMQLSKLIRTVKIKNEVYLLLQQQYYKERIQENRDVPTIDILDEAIPPEKTSFTEINLFNILEFNICSFNSLIIFYYSGKRKYHFSKRKEASNYENCCCCWWCWFFRFSSL